MKSLFVIVAIGSIALVGCKKKGCTDPLANNYNSEAEKDDGNCTFDSSPAYTVPGTYLFTDASGNSTVSYSGQTERLDQLDEMVTLMKTGNSHKWWILIIKQDNKNLVDNSDDNLE